MLITKNTLGKTHMKIVILTPKSEFTKQQTQALSRLGKVVYTDSRRCYSLVELVSLSQGADILAADPDNLGGFEAAPTVIPQLLNKAPSIHGLALSTTSYGYIDQKYCQGRGIKVTNIPHYSSESVAEHSLALLLGCVKRIFLSDRRSQLGQYKLEMGYEISGKTLGIIGLGSIGRRTAELAQALGMKVIAWNRTHRQVKGVKLTSLDNVLSQSDFISIHLIDSPATAGFLSVTKSPNSRGE